MTNGNGSRTLRLSVLQRIGLDSVLAEQKGKREELRVFYNIRRKIRMEPAEKQQYWRPLGNGQSMFNDEAAAKAEDFEVTFSQDEVRRLIKLGDSMDLLCGILDWFEPLLQELEEKTP